MSQILSQDEVDALLKGMSEGEIETEREQVDNSAVQPYDLTSQDRIIRGRMPTLEMMSEKFARLFRMTLSSLLRKVINIDTSSVNMAKFGDFLKTLPIPASLHVFKMDPLIGNSLIVFESKLIFTFVDIFFGGSGREDFRIEGRGFTAIENNLIEKVVLNALADLESVWKSLIDVNIVYLRSEINPQFAQIVVPNDVVIVVKFEIEMGFSSSNIILCIPCSTIEPIREKLQSGYQSDELGVNIEWVKRFEEKLRLSNVNLTVELGKTELSGREIANLKKGDVILLDRHFSDDLDVYVEGLLKFKGQAGVYRGNRAIQLSRSISRERMIQDGTK